ncbi:unnamed protein product [Cuscuta europaea]|uniref:Uncharacterized protein n=1 Tax=Cuscuta europaea TaxID=41803 RepID=A0A9P0Z1R2_CUSEU|nr:unnamed protein product [Cuscuta europaea]
MDMLPQYVSFLKFSNGMYHVCNFVTPKNVVLICFCSLLAMFLNKELNKTECRFVVLLPNLSVFVWVIIAEGFPANHIHPSTTFASTCVTIIMIVMMLLGL